MNIQSVLYHVGLSPSSDSNSVDLGKISFYLTKRGSGAYIEIIDFINLGGPGGWGGGCRLSL